MPDPPTILLVDDEESVQKLLTYPLERDGFRVVHAWDGEEALAKFSEEDVDLVVLDLMLPKLDGLEVCKRLRSESTVPIIMLTARDDELDKVLGLELGADDYITKPFSIREFRSRVRALLRRAAAPRPGEREGEEVIEAGEVRIDVPRRTVEVRGTRRSSPSSSSNCCGRSPPHQAASSRAGSCSNGCGAAPTIASHARSTCTCAICARRSRRTHTTRR